MTTGGFRVLMLTTSWPLTDGDYRGGFVRDLAADLGRHGCHVDVAVPAPAPGQVPPGFDDQAPIPGVAVHWLPKLMPIRSRAFHESGIEANLVRHPLSALSLAPTLGALAAECSLLAPFADVIVSNWLLPMGAVGATLAGVTGKQHLIIAHSAPPVPARVYPLSALVRKVVESASSVACVSESVRAATAAVVGPGLESRLEVRHLGIDLRPVVARKRPGRPMQVLFVGRLVHLKGVDILIRALAGLDGCHLTVAGDGPEARSLRRLAAIHGVKVDFAGQMDREAVRRRMALADVLVIPSRRTLLGREEGLPRVLVEAWAAGLPVLASATGGTPGVLKSRGGGLLFDAGSVGDLRRRILDLLSEPGLLDRLSGEAMRAAVDFDADRTATGWIDWISRACP